MYFDDDNSSFLAYQNAMKEMKEEQRLREQADADEEAKMAAERQDRYSGIYEQSLHVDETSTPFQEYKQDVLSRLMETGLGILFNKCAGKTYLNTVSEDTKAFNKSLIANFVHEEGVENLIDSFRCKTPLLAEMAYVIESAAASILEEADPEDPSTFVTSKDEEEFFDNIDGSEEVEDLCDIIRNRVASDAQNFMDANRLAKSEIIATMQDSQEQMDSVQTGDEEQDAIVQYEFAMELDDKKQAILDRPHGIMEAMMRSMTNDIIRNEALREQYTNESGSLNNDDIYEKVLARYTFMEMVQALHIKEIDADTLKEEVL